MKGPLDAVDILLLGHLLDGGPTELLGEAVVLTVEDRGLAAGTGWSRHSLGEVGGVEVKVHRRDRSGAEISGTQVVLGVSGPHEF